MTSANVSFDLVSPNFDVGNLQLSSNPRDIGLYRYPISGGYKPSEVPARKHWRKSCISHTPRVSPKVDERLISAFAWQNASIGANLASVG